MPCKCPILQICMLSFSLSPLICSSLFLVTTNYWTKVLINGVKIFGAEYFLVDNMNSILHPNRKHECLVISLHVMLTDGLITGLKW